MGCSSFVLKDSMDFHSMGLFRYCHYIDGYVGKTSLRCGAVSLSHCMCHIFLYMSRGPLVVRWFLCTVSDVYYLTVHFGFQLF